MWGTETWYNEDSHPQAGDQYTLEITTITEVLPRGSPHIRFPRPGVLNQEDEPSQAVKVRRACIQENQKATGNRDSTLQWHRKISHAPKTLQRQWCERSRSQTYLLVLKSLSETQEATGTKNKDSGSSHLGELILHEDTGMIRPLWSTPSRELAQGDYPHTTPGSTSSGTRHSKKPAMQGRSLAQQWISTSHAPGHRPPSQLPQNPALHISGLVPAPGSPSPIVGAHQDPALHVSGQAPAPRSSRTSPTHQQANISPWTCARSFWDLLPVMLGPSPTHQWLAALPWCRSWQPTRPEASPAHQHTHGSCVVSQAYFNKK